MADTYIDLFWGYTAIWLLIAFFLFHLANSQRKVFARLEQLEEEYGKTLGREEGIVD